MIKILEHKDYQEIIKRSKGRCEVCGGMNGEVQMHHIISGHGKRKQHENIDSIICLCWECHHSNEGVHGKNGRELNLKLKVKLQKTYFKQGYSEEKVREMMGGKLYEM